MLRRLSTIAAGAAMLALSALPASAATASATHTLHFPGLSGVIASGSYSKTGSKVKIKVCVEDTKKGEFAAAAVFLAYNSSYSAHIKGGAVDIGYHDKQCTTMTTLYSAHLRIYTFVGGSNGKVLRQSKTKIIY
jgi:hypothetical protein